MLTHTNAIYTIFATTILGASLCLANGFNEPPCQPVGGIGGAGGTPSTPPLPGQDSCWTPPTDLPIFDLVGNDGHVYSVYVFKDESNQPQATAWWQANRYAQSVGGYLAEITTDSENDQVFSKIQTVSAAWTGCHGPWIGLYRDVQCHLAGGDTAGGDWKWCTASAPMNPFDFSDVSDNNFTADSQSDRTNFPLRTCFDGTNGPSKSWLAIPPTPYRWVPRQKITGSVVYAAVIEKDSMTDCNGNGLDDSVDINNGTDDVNDNWVPDGCECLADGNY